MVQGHFAGLQFQHDGVALVHLDHDFLAAAEQVFRAEGVVVGHLVEFVGAGDDPHGAVGGGAVGEGDPGGDDVGGVEAPVCGVLMPGDEAGVVGFLDEKGTAPAQDVRADDVLDGIEDGWVADEVVEPGEQQVGFVAQFAGHRAGVAFEGFQFVAQGVGLGTGHDPDGGVVAVLPVVADGRLGQCLHGFLRFAVAGEHGKRGR